MATPQGILTERLRSALEAARLDSSRAVVVPTADPNFGDYQTNAAMVIAHEHRRNPREVAAEILAALDVSGIAGAPTVAGAGFINFTLTGEFLSRQLAGVASDPRIGLAPVITPKTILIDFSSPNVAKPMHVCHKIGRAHV